MHEILTQRPHLHGLFHGDNLAKIECRVERLDERTLAESPLHFCYNRAIGCDNEWREVRFFDSSGNKLGSVGPDGGYGRPGLQEIHAAGSYEGWTVGDGLLSIIEPSQIVEIVTLIHRFNQGDSCEVIVHLCKGFDFEKWISAKREKASASLLRTIQLFCTPDSAETLPIPIRFTDRFMIEAIGGHFPFANVEKKLRGLGISQIVLSPVSSAAAKWSRYLTYAVGGLEMVSFFDAGMNEVMALDLQTLASQGVTTLGTVSDALNGHAEEAARIRYVVEMQYHHGHEDICPDMAGTVIFINLAVVPDGLSISDAILRPPPLKR